LLALVVFLTAAFALVRGFTEVGRSGGVLPSPVPTSVPVVTPRSAALAPASPPAVTPTPSGPLPIGIIAGHWGNDSGAVCDGWLREVDIDLAVAQRVVNTLRALGYEVDLLEERDVRLAGYQARALIAIHADSCLYPEASGFKVARVEDSAVPQLEDQLKDCLVSRYGARTGLTLHEGSVTSDMTHYHIFYEVDTHTPGVIIEMGFMLADRDLLLNRQDLVAQGIVDGILCFLEEETP
jgi:N-acetylmuramoyl-L-alanine amidase